MAVLDPVKLIITNYPDNQTEQLISENGPDEVLVPVLSLLANNCG
jgi:hypothetical protein